MLPRLGDPPQPAALLRQAAELLKEPAWQGNTEVWVLPVLDPDRWVRGTAAAIHWESNFPWRWTPWNDRGVNPGSSPLCVAESKGLLQVLVGEPALIGVLEFGPVPDGDADGQEPAEGSLEGYAQEILGLPWLGLDSAELTVGLFALRERADQLQGR